MAEDLYSLWLKIPPGPRPPDYYALLGVPRFCEDVKRIEEEARKRLEALDRYALHRDPAKRDACQQMMNEVARARVVLTSDQKRAAYDLTLAPGRGSATAVTPPVVAAPARAKPAQAFTQDKALSRHVSATTTPASDGAEVTRRKLLRWILPTAAALLIGAVLLFWKLSSPSNPPANPMVAKDDDAIRKVTTTQVTVTTRSVAIATRPTTTEVVVASTKPIEAPTAAATSQPAPIPKVSGSTLSPIPSEADQMAASKRITAAFASDRANAKSPAEKIALARNMIEMARTIDNNPAGRYVLLSSAGSLAVEAGDVDLAMVTIDATARWFEADALQLKSKTLLAFTENISPASDTTALAAQIDTVIAQALAADRFDVASEVGVIAMRAAKNAQDKGWALRANTFMGDLREIQLEFLDTTKARAALKTNPADPAANWRMGRYRCWFTENWPAGLALLAKSSDPDAKALAQIELAKPADAESQKRLADGWWDLSEHLSSLEQIRVRRHAAEIYAVILPKFKGTSRPVVVQRLDDIDASRGKVVDLMPLIELKGNVTGGNWTMHKDGLAIGNEGYFHLLRIPYQPPDEYDFHLEFIGSEHRVRLEPLLIHAGVLFGVQLSQVYAKFNSSYSLDCFDHTTPNRSTVNGPVLEAGKAYSTIIRVRRDHVAVLIDGAQIMCFETDYSGLKMMTNRTNPPEKFVVNALGLCVPQGPLFFTKLEVIEIKQLPPVPGKDHQ